MSALKGQVGGGHYKEMKIQPVEFIHANGIGFLEGCIIKRICRWRSKDGIKDLEKIKHEVDLLIELESVKEAPAPAAKDSYACVRKQFSDITLCETCGLSWDTNDPAPPACPNALTDAGPRTA